MPFTVRDIINDAKVLNRKTQERAMISEASPEIVAAVNRSLYGIYSVGARVNPGYHGETANVTDAGGGVWVRPADAELIYLILDSDGEEVLVADPREPSPDPGFPSVVRWGGTYRRPSEVPEPEGVLQFWYSRRPQEAANAESTVDLEDAFRSLMVYDIGAWLARRDERYDELQALSAMLDGALQLYLMSLVHENVSTVRTVGQLGTFDSSSLVELKQLLLSGAHPTAGP